MQWRMLSVIRFTLLRLCHTEMHYCGHVLDSDCRSVTDYIEICGSIIWDALPLS